MKESPLSLAQTERLVLLVEECGEVIQAATKILRYGYDGVYESGVLNRHQIELEIGDVLAVTDLLIGGDDVDSDSIELYAKEKKKKLKRNTLHQGDQE